MTKNKTQKRFSSHFDVIFVGILGGDQSKHKRFDLVSRKISLLVHIKTIRGPHKHNLLHAEPKRGLGSPVLGYEDIFETYVFKHNIPVVCTVLARIVL